MTCGCSMSGGWGWFMGPVGLVVMVAFWALLIWGGIVLVRHLTGAGAGGTGNASGAERVLSRRFAAGEIDEDEYRQRLDTLRSVEEARALWPWGSKR